MDSRCVSSRDLHGFVQIGAVQHVDWLEALRQRPQAVERRVIVEAIARRLAADLLLTPARAPQARHIGLIGSETTSQFRYLLLQWTHQLLVSELERKLHTASAAAEVEKLITSIVE